MKAPLNPILTIGYASLPIERFIGLLRLHQIGVVADVRSQPYSRHMPEYSYGRLKETLEKSGIRYVFMGKELGARREEPECYLDGKVSYDLVGRTTAFREGISRLEEGAKTYCIALLCAEKDPLDCHRALLVSRELCRQGIEVKHIIHDGSLESHAELERRLVAPQGRGQADLFENEP